MKQIKTDYIVNTQTKALIPARTIEYQTIACEPNRQIYIAQTPLEIIKRSCDRHWSSYEGRRTIVMKRMGFKQKVPISISLKHNLLLFPTHSPQHHDASWLAITHIKHVIQISTQPHQTRILFKNGTNIDINVSLHTMRTQIARTAACFTHIQWQEDEILSPVAEQPTDNAAMRVKSNRLPNNYQGKQHKYRHQRLFTHHSDTKYTIRRL